MQIEQKDEFSHSPIMENQLLFLQLRCVYCDFTICASSLDELLDKEQRHLAECSCK